MTMKTFKVAGITEHNLNAKVRFTDDIVRRIKQFNKGGATRVELVELPFAMNKIDALNYLVQHSNFQSPSDQATISEYLHERLKNSNNGTVKVKVKNKPNLEDIKARAKIMVN